MLTSNGNNILRVVVEDWQNVTRYANYRTFRVAGEDHDYYLSVWGYSGNAGNMLCFIIYKVVKYRKILLIYNVYFIFSLVKI